MNPALFTDTVTITPGAVTTPFRIEPNRLVAGYRGALRQVGEERGTHHGYAPTQLTNPDGTAGAALAIPKEAHLVDQNGVEYLVTGVPLQARARSGVDHLEVWLQVLAEDSIVITRPSNQTDAEGASSGTTTTTVATVNGTWGEPSVKDIEFAGQRGERVDAVATVVTVAAQPADFVTAMGASWLVVSVEKWRVHSRLLLRRISESV